MKKTYEWKLSNGQTAKLIAECETEIRNEVINSDGYEIETGEKEIITRANLVAYVDDVKIESCWDTSFWRIIDTDTDGVKRIQGIQKIGFTSERAEEVGQFLKSVIDESKPEEVVVIEIERKSKEIAKEIESCESVIVKCESQKELPTKDEAKKRMKRYNDIMNEGGEGYVPYIYSQKDYENAKLKLSKLKSQI